MHFVWLWFIVWCVWLQLCCGPALEMGMHGLVDRFLHWNVTPIIYYTLGWPLSFHLMWSSCQIYQLRVRSPLTCWQSAFSSTLCCTRCSLTVLPDWHHSNDWEGKLCRAGPMSVRTRPLTCQWLCGSISEFSPCVCDAVWYFLYSLGDRCIKG